MLTALRRRLTLLMTALTSLVLAGALVVTWNYAAAQYRTAAETLLTQNFSAIVDRLDQLEGQLRKACPDLPEEARTVILRVIADARNEWIRSTSKLVADSLDRMAQSEGDEPDALDISEGAA